MKHGIQPVHPPGADGRDRTTYLDEYFDTQVYPVLTPLAIDPAHPFPHVHNKSLNLLMRIESIKPHARPLYAVLQVPSVINRLVPLARRNRRPEAVRLARRRHRPTARRALRRLSHHRARGVSRHAQQRSDDPGKRGQEQPALDNRRDPPPAQVGSGRAAGDLGSRRRRLSGPSLLSTSALELEARDVYRFPARST